MAHFYLRKKVTKATVCKNRFRPRQINYSQKTYKVIKKSSRILALKMQLLPIAKNVLKDHNLLSKSFWKIHLLELSEKPRNQRSAVEELKRSCFY